MSEPVMLKKKSEAEKEEKEFMKLTSPRVTATEREDYEQCLSRFRAVCMQVRQLIGVPDFRGGYDEWRKLALDPEWVNNSELTRLSRQCDAINLETNYEAGKLGIISPDWWKECWMDELVGQMHTQQ